MCRGCCGLLICSLHSYIYHLDSCRLKVGLQNKSNFFILARKIHKIIMMFPFTVQSSSYLHSSCAFHVSRGNELFLMFCPLTHPHYFASSQGFLVSHPRQDPSRTYFASWGKVTALSLDHSDYPVAFFKASALYVKVLMNCFENQSLSLC